MASDDFETTCHEDEMSTAALSDLDVRVREHVAHQLDWDPEVDASGIGVSPHRHRVRQRDVLGRASGRDLKMIGGWT
jgi:hypothetical protein